MCVSHCLMADPGTDPVTSLFLCGALGRDSGVMLSCCGRFFGARGDCVQCWFRVCPDACVVSCFGLGGRHLAAAVVTGTLLRLLGLKNVFVDGVRQSMRVQRKNRVDKSWRCLTAPDLRVDEQQGATPGFQRDALTERGRGLGGGDKTRRSGARVLFYF